MKNKRFSALILILSLLISSLAAIPQTGYASSDGTLIADLTSEAAIEKSGLAVNTRYYFSGEMSAEWSGADLSREIIVPVSKKHNLSEGFLEFPVYNGRKAGMQFAVVLLSDNPETSMKDYYYIKLNASWQGWKTISANLEPLTGNAAADESAMTWSEYEQYEAKYGSENLYPRFLKKGSPLNLSSIDEIRLWPDYEEKSETQDSLICFDKFTLKDTRSSNAALFSEVCEAAEVPELILKDFSVAANVPKGLEYSTSQSLNGTGSAKLASPNLTGSVSMQTVSDWTGYNAFNIDIYSEKATGSKFHLVVVSDNPGTDGSDYYSSWITFDWEGYWQTFTFYFETSNNQTDFKSDRSPVGFTDITSLAIWKSSGGNVISEDTVAYIGKIYLTYEAPVALTDYLPPEADYKYMDLDVIGDLKSTVDRKEHPRVYTTKEKFAHTLEMLENGDPYLTDTTNRLLATADGYLDTAPTQYSLPDGIRLTSAANTVINNLSVAYAVSGEEKYKERLWTELESVCNWSDWNPRHFLDVGGVAQAVAAAYDLCYDAWTPYQRDVISSSLVKNAIVPAVRLWRNGRGNWVNNWQQVITGGVGCAALAVIDEPDFTQICAEYICHIMDTLPAGLGEYAPDGMMPEGVGYWTYATQYFVPYNMAMFNTLGTDYGLSELPGVDKNAYFPIISLGSTGKTFNFSDSSVTSGARDPSMLLTAMHYNQPEIAAYFISKSAGNGNWNSVLWYTDEFEKIDYREKMPLDMHYRPNMEFESTNDVAYTRASWFDKNSVWLAYKGRTGNAGGHADLDAGQFVLEMQGIRWFSDLGTSDYNLPGMFNTTDSTATKRWVYYRKRAEAHNTIVINPTQNNAMDQLDTSNSLITKFETSPYASYGVIDMTEAYPDTTEAIRGFALKNNRSEVVVQDEIKADKPIELYSFFTTEHNIELTSDPKIAYIRADSGERIRLDIVSPADAKWEQMDAVPLPTSPHPEGDSMGEFSNEDYSKLFIHLNSAVNPNVSVLIRNAYEGVTPGEPEPMKPIASWDEYFEEYAAIDKLLVSGVPIEGFEASNSNYSLECVTGELSAEYDPDKVSVEFAQVSELGETATCTVTDKKTGKETVYYVTFKEVFIEIDPTVFDEVPITGVEASAVPQPANMPEHTYDGDFDTRWSAEGEQWITWILDGEYELEQILLSFWKGNERATSFDIYTSTDKQNWEQVFSGTAAGNTENLEIFKFDKTVRAKYVKLCGRGNSINAWNSILEVYIPQMLKPLNDIAGHWAEDSINQMRLLGLVNGTSETTFEPESNVTRAEFIAMAVRSLGTPETAYAGGFSDISGDEWYADVIQTAKSDGIIPGDFIQNGMIYPEKSITREEAAAILGLVSEKIFDELPAEANLSMFKDESEISPSYKSPVARTVTARFMNGISADTFAPGTTLTRAEAATVVKRVYVAGK